MTATEMKITKHCYPWTFFPPTPSCYTRALLNCRYVLALLKTRTNRSITAFQRYHRKHGFYTFKITVQPPFVLSQACKRAGIPLAPELLHGGIWNDGHEMTDKLRLPNLFPVGT